MQYDKWIEDNLEEFRQNYFKFMKFERSRNTWIFGGDTLEVYIRKANHLIGDTMYSTLDIANVQVADNVRGKGIGMLIVNWLHASHPYQVTYIESLQNLSFYDHLKRHGWQDVPHSKPPSVFKPV